MPYITYSSGLTIKSPTRGTRNYEATMRTDTWQKISEHDHTGSGRGSQLGTAAIAADAINDLKIRLRNDQWLRGRNSADSGDINILKVDTENRIGVGAGLNSAQVLSLNNNTTAVLGISFDAAKVLGATLFYSVKRIGSSTVVESGTIQLVFNGTSWEISPERIGGAGISFTISNAGAMSYTTTNLAGHVSSTMYYLAVSTGV